MSADLENSSPSQYPTKDELSRRRRFDLERQRVTERQERQAAASSTAKSAAVVQELARRSGEDPEALASRIDADTLRRLKNPMVTQVNPDGTRTYKHDLGIVEGIRSGYGTDRGESGVTAAPQPRDELGKFIRQ